MPAARGRLAFLYLRGADTTCAADRPRAILDFIEHTIGANQYNGNTTRVDAFGLKIAMRLHCADGFDRAVGEDYETFLEDRAVTFQKFIDSVPDEFKPLAQPPFAPYRIVEPGRGGFSTGGAYEHYYDTFVDEIWAVNGTVPKPGANGMVRGGPRSSAPFFGMSEMPQALRRRRQAARQESLERQRHVYAAAPANYYARLARTRAKRKSLADPMRQCLATELCPGPRYLLVAVRLVNLATCKLNGSTPPSTYRSARTVDIETRKRTLITCERVYRLRRAVAPSSW
jgi:hypothetical protein